MGGGAIRHWVYGHDYYGVSLPNILRRGPEKLRVCCWLRLRAANGLEIPYIGCMELDCQVLGEQITKRGVLVIRDTPDASPSPEVWRSWHEGNT